MLGLFVYGGINVAKKITVEWIQELIDKDELWRFYKHPEWIKLKKKILKENHYECAECRSQGIITRYDIDSEGGKKLISTVHHVCHVRDHPELALSRTYKDYETGETLTNLLPVCKACHNKLHPEKHKNKSKDKFSNEERW